MSELSLTGSLSISNQLMLSASLLDTDGNTGTMGQVFSSTVTGSKWVDADSGAQGTQGTQGVQGEIGTQGTQGIQGETGTTGTQGTQGTQGETGTQGEIGTQGTTGTDGTFGGASFDYTFDTSTTSGDPGAGKLRLNNTTQNTATGLYIDSTDDNANSINSFMQSIKDVTSAVKGHVRVSSKTNANTFLLFEISDLTNNTGWWTIDIGIEAFSAASPFSNSDDIIASFVTTGDRGDKGDTGTQGTAGDTGAQGTSGATPFPYIGDAQITGSLLVQGDAQVEGNDAFVYQGKGATTGYQGIKLENSAGNFQAGVATNVGVFFSDSTANSANIGTTQEKNLHLAVNDLTKIFVSSSGNVGIGPSNTTGVDNKLSIEGSGLADENVLKINNQVNASTRIWLRNSAQSAYIFNSGVTPDTLATGLLSQAVGMGIANDSPVQFFTGLTPTVKLTVSTTGVEITGSFQSTGSAEFSYMSGSTSAATWSTGGALSSINKDIGGAGTQNAGLAFGGRDTGNIISCCTEEYNGTSWSAGGALATARIRLAGAGIQNAALAFGGSSLAASQETSTEEYNGTAWSSGGAMQVGKKQSGGTGTQDAALAFGGEGTAQCTEEYNGTAWSTGGALQVGRYLLAGAGTQNAGLAFGGGTPFRSCTEEYDGSSWSTGGALAVARYGLAGAGAQDAALAIGGRGNAGILACTEEYNGTSWSAGNALAVARYSLGGAGTTTAGLAFGGINASFQAVTCTEEYTEVITYTPKKTFEYDDTTGDVDISGSFEITGSAAFLYSSGSVSTAAWSTGGALNNGRKNLGGAGTQDAGLAFGGQTSATGGGSNGTNCTEEYDGTSWTAGGALATARYCLGGAGTQNAGLAFGGGCNSTYFAYSCTEEYNGTAWSNGGALQVARVGAAGAGTQNAALAAGGFVIANPFYNICACTEEYNGTSWSTGGVISDPYLTVGWSATGTQNAALAFGDAYEYQNTTTLEYDGTSWTAGGALNTGRCGAGAAGTQNAGLAMGGGNSYSCCATEEYNGTSWSNGGNMAVSRQSLAGAGTQAAGLAFGGTYCPVGGGTITILACTEEYNEGTTAYTPKKSFEYDKSNGIVILSEVASSSQDYEDDTAAAAGGVPVGGLYRNGNVVSIRIS